MIKKSNESRPNEVDEETDPRNLKTGIQLFPHQRQALAWLLWRENQHPGGGILADDMGLGKTLTLIALIIKSRVNTTYTVLIPRHTELLVVLSQIEMSNNNLYIFEFLTP